MKKNKTKSAVKSNTREWIEAIVVAVVLALFIRTFFVQAFKIPSGSMMPTLKPGDRILVNKLFYGPQIPLLGLKLPMIQQPQRADVIVFVYPESANQRNFINFKRYIDDDALGSVFRRIFIFIKETQNKDYIKRLVGLPGENIEIKNGDIYINGRPVENSHIRKNVYLNEGPYGQARELAYVPKDSYYCLGDNSSSSRDSRYWGFVDKKYLIGKAILIYWPINRIGIIR
jgi:signal peptidase I